MTEYSVEAGGREQLERSSTRALIAQLREEYGRVAYTHKTHEKCADLILRKLSRIKLSQIALSAVTTAGFLAAILGDGKEASVVGALLSVLLFGINAYTKDVDLGKLAQRHRQAAAELWGFREGHLSLLADLQDVSVSAQEARKRRDQMLVELKNLYSTIPSTTSKAYKEAQKMLKMSEELTFSDEELDRLLPSAMRSSSSD